MWILLQFCGLKIWEGLWARWGWNVSEGGAAIKLSFFLNWGKSVLVPLGSHCPVVRA